LTKLTIKKKPIASSQSSWPNRLNKWIEQTMYTILRAIPTVADYRRLREEAGLSPKTLVASERGLANTLFAVQVLTGDEVVGMGRVIGDGGCFYQVVDIAVLPQHQGRGLGKVIMGEIAGYIEREVPESGYVSLLADGNAYQLYQQFGFVLTAPASVGMGLKKAGSGSGI
jgi:GNAT superfamily N-acetyltransferase